MSNLFQIVNIPVIDINDIKPVISSKGNSCGSNASIWNEVQLAQSNEKIKGFKEQIEDLKQENKRLGNEIGAMHNILKEQAVSVASASFRSKVKVKNVQPKETESKLESKVEQKVEPKVEQKIVNKMMSSYGKIVSVSNLEDVYNKELSTKLAKQSEIETAGRIKSTGWCARYVNNAFERIGLVKKNSTRCGSAYMLERRLDSCSAFKRVNVSRDKIKDLPEGCVVVWQKGSGFGNDFANHGHIFITQGNGEATSDYKQKIIDYGTDFAVYVPVLA